MQLLQQVSAYSRNKVLEAYNTPTDEQLIEYEGSPSNYIQYVYNQYQFDRLKEIKTNSI